MQKAAENEFFGCVWRRPPFSVRTCDELPQINVGREPASNRRAARSAGHLSVSWHAVRQQIAVARRLILLSDFDGTLVPLERRPSDVRMPESLRRLLRRLARRATKVGIISGRAIEDVRRKVGVDHIWYAGSHGYFLSDPQGRAIRLLLPKIESQMKSLSRLLRLRFRFASGLEVEPKGATVAVHYRRASRAERTWAYEVLCDVLAGKEHLRLMPGKKVWEVLPVGVVDKWKAVQVILDREHFASGEDLLVYMGDDVTDEVVFRKMSGLSVCIGEALRTAADFYLESPLEVREFLLRIDELRKVQKSLELGSRAEGGIHG